MALKDRLKNKKTTEVQEINDIKEIYTSLDEKQAVEFNLSVSQLTQKILDVQDNANLGAIVKEFAKFMNSVSDNETILTLKGNFDIGKKALLSCLISNISEQNVPLQSEPETPKEDSKLIKKRKTLREKLKKVRLNEEE